MPEELKINVGVGGAEAAKAALHDVAAGETAVGAAAKSASPAIAGTATAKKAAGDAADELKMRDRSLLREFAMISPECGLVAEAFQNLQKHTTGTGLALGMIGVAIGAATLAYSKFSEVQAEQKAKAAAVIAGLQAQSEAYLKLAASAEKAAQTRGVGIGAGKGEGLAARFLGLAPEGVSREARDRAVQLAGVAGRGLTDAEVIALQQQTMMGEDERVKGNDRRKATSLLARQAGVADRMKAFIAASPDTTQTATLETLSAQQALTPSGKFAEKLKGIDQVIGSNPLGERMLSPAQLQLLKDIRSRPDLAGAQEYGLTPAMYLPGGWGGYGEHYSPKAGGEKGIVIIERAVINQGGVHYNAPHADPAGVVPRNPTKN